MAYGYGGYTGAAPGYYQPTTPGYYQPGAPAPDQLAQLRAQQMQQQYAQPIGPHQPMQGMQTAPQQAQHGGSGQIWVQGEAGAKSYMVAPESSVMLMDSERQTFYIKSADKNGMPLPLRIFDYVERPQAPQGAVVAAQQPAQQVQTIPVDYVPRAEFDALVARVEAITAPKRTRKQQTEEATQDGE